MRRGYGRILSWILAGAVAFSSYPAAFTGVNVYAAEVADETEDAVYDAAFEDGITTDTEDQADGPVYTAEDPADDVTADETDTEADDEHAEAADGDAAGVSDDKEITDDQTDEAISEDTAVSDDAIADEAADDTPDDTEDNPEFPDVSLLRPHNDAPETVKTSMKRHTSDMEPKRFGSTVYGQVIDYSVNGKDYVALYLYGTKDNSRIDFDNVMIGDSIYGTLAENTVTDIIMDDHITGIDSGGCFMEMGQVTYVRLSENLKSIDGSTFDQCTSLPEITIPASLEEAGASNFTECSSLKTVRFEDGIRAVPDHLFATNNHGAVETVYLPPSIKEVGERAFEGQDSLSTVIFTDPSKTVLARIGGRAFAETNLSNITLPKFGGTWKDKGSNLTMNPEIGSQAFCGIKNATFSTLVIPEGVTELGQITAVNANWFVDIYLPKSLTKFASTFVSFDDMGTLDHIYYAGSKKDFFKKYGRTEADLKNSGVKWVEKLVFATAAPSEVRTITSEKMTVVKYKDDIPDAGIKETLTLSVSPVTHAEAVYRAVSTDPDNVIPTLGTEIDGKLPLTLDIQKKMTDATVTVTGGLASLDIHVVVKEKEKTLRPEISGIAGTGIYGGPVALVSQTPGAQIFYQMVPHDEMNPEVKDLANYEYVSANGIYRATDPKIIEYTSPLIYGEDIPENMKLCAIAVAPGHAFSPMNSEKYGSFPRNYWGNITEEDQAEFGGDPSKIPEGVWAPASQISGNNVVYTGKKLTIPGLRVYYGNERLRLKTDYTLQYSNNIKAADPSDTNPPTIQVNLKGNHTGTAKLYFKISPAKIDVTKVKYTAVYMPEGDSSVPDLNVKYAGKAMKNGIDYDICYRKHGTSEDWIPTPAGAGTYDAYIDIHGNYIGGYYADDALTIINPDAVKMSAVTVSKIPAQNIADWEAEGYEAKPAFTVTYGGKPLDPSQYTAEFADNDRAGTAMVIIRGTGTVIDGQFFMGTKIATFKVKGLPFNARTVTVSGMQASYDYTGMPVIPAGMDGFSLKYGDRKLNMGSDYDVTFNNAHTNAGKVVMIVKGQGIYSGNFKKNFTINKLDITGEGTKMMYAPEHGSPREWSDDTVSVVYKKTGVKPSILLGCSNGHGGWIDATYTVKYAGNRLVARYDATNKRGKRVGPSVTIKGKGNFKGSITRYFTITRADDGYVRISSIPDMVVSSKPYAVSKKPVIIDWSYAKLKAGTDYEKEFEYFYADDAVVTNVTGKGKKAVRSQVLRRRGDAVDKGDILPAGTVIGFGVQLKGNYTGYVWDTFTVASKNIKELKFSMKPGVEHKYTGSLIAPGKDEIAVSVRQGRTWVPLAEEEAKRLYDITGYGPNVKKGKGTIKIKAKNGYAGTAVVPFTIKAR